MDLATRDNNVMESDYVCMNNEDREKIKIKRRKSSKRPTRKRSIKVKRRQSVVKRNVSVKREKKRKAVRTKSFIVKRKSFRAPSRWSSYLREERKLKNLRVHEGRLPRVRGVWRERRYTEVRTQVQADQETERKVWRERINKKTVTSIPRPKVRETGERSVPASSDSGVYSGSGSGYSNTNYRSGEYWRSKHQVSWRQMILTTLPPHHTRQERQEEELCRKFERLYQKNKNYERKCNRYSGSGLRITPDVSTLTKTYWDYPQAKRGWDMYVHRAGPCGLETGQCEDITEERQKGVEIFSLRPERRGLRPARPVQQPLRNFKYLTIDL